MTSGVKTSPRSRKSWSARRASSEASSERGVVGTFVELLGLEVVDVLVEWLAGADLVLDAVEDGHEHGREEQVGIGGARRGRGTRSAGSWGWGC